MTSKLGAFTFDSSSAKQASDALLVNVKRSSSKDDLLKYISKQMSFPDYFGNNWDAFEECLKDLSWMKQKSVVISHQALPDLPDDDLRIYLDVLVSAVNTWASDGSRSFVVSFPEGSREEIANLTGAK